MPNNFFFLSDRNLKYAGCIENSSFLSHFIDGNCDYGKISATATSSKMPALVHADKFKVLDIVPNMGEQKGFLLSEKTHDLLAGFNLPPNRFHPMDLERKGRTLPGYGFLHIAFLDEKTPAPLLFDKTRMGRFDSPAQHSFASIDDAIESGFSLMHNAEIWLSDHARQFDLFKFRGLAYFVASQRLARAVSAAKISGAVVEPALSIKN